VPSATSALDKLKEYGGFAFLENIIDGFSNLNPTRKARRNIFLTDEQWAGERKVLANRLNVWLELLKSGESAEKMRDKAKSKAQSVEELLNKNLHTALNRVHDLETAYRSVALFYKNTESSKVKNVTIVNADMAQLKDLDNTLFIDYIGNELSQNFDRLDLRRNYSILIIPGYLGSNAVLDKWAKMAHDNKVMLVTDFQDLETPNDVVDIFFNADHTGGDVYKSNVIMTCNYLLGRPKVAEVGEEENLYVPGSGALAGLGGVVEGLGTYQNVFVQGSSLSVGFNGMAVSLLAANSPIGILFAAFLFAVLSVGAPGMNVAQIPTELVNIVTASIIFFVSVHYIIERFVKPKKQVKGGK